MADNNQESQVSRDAYWKANLKLLTIMLSVWFAISYLCGIVFVTQLNAIHLGGFKLGFWFAQQGSMYGFVAIIFIYARLMDKLDRKFNVHE